jgi:hypothetical protein
LRIDWRKFLAEPMERKEGIAGLWGEVGGIKPLNPMSLPVLGPVRVDICLRSGRCA